MVCGWIAEDIAEIVMPIYSEGFIFLGRQSLLFSLQNLTQACEWNWSYFNSVVKEGKFWIFIIIRHATSIEPLNCVYKFDYDKYSGTFDLEDDNSPVGEVSRHKFYG